MGIDEGWEGCGMGVNHTQHYVNGTPAVCAARGSNVGHVRVMLLLYTFKDQQT